MGRDGEHGPRLREMVCSRKTALKDLGAVRAKLSLGVPPALRIHLAASGNSDPHRQQPIESDLLFHFSPAPSIRTRVSNRCFALRSRADAPSGDAEGRVRLLIADSANHPS
jgi:hypothetical protein